MEKVPRIISLLLVPVCLALLIAFPHPAAFGLVHGNMLSHLTYLWFHGNLLHYAINIYCLCTLTFLCGINLKAFLTGLVAAVCLPGFVIGSMPIVGLSGWLFFLSGSLTFRLQKKDRLRFVATNIFVVLVTSLLSHIAWGVHLWCFALGIIYSFIESHKATSKRTA